MKVRMFFNAGVSAIFLGILMVNAAHAQTETIGMLEKNLDRNAMKNTVYALEAPIGDLKVSEGYRRLEGGNRIYDFVRAGASPAGQYYYYCELKVPRLYSPADVRPGKNHFLEITPNAEVELVNPDIFPSARRDGRSVFTSRLVFKTVMGNTLGGEIFCETDSRAPTSTLGSALRSVGLSLPDDFIVIKNPDKKNIEFVESESPASTT